MSPAGGFPGRVFCWPEGGRDVRVRASRTSYRPETRLVHAGILRSQFGETSEALFLTQGYVYDNAAQAEARFKGEDPGYQYSRFANPTVTMFEQRMAAFEGAEAARATATGMAAVTAALMGQVKAGDHVVGVQGAVRLLPLRGRGLPAALRRDLDAGRRHRSRRMARGGAAEHQDLLPRKPDQSRRSRCSTSPTIAEIAHAAGATLVVDNVFSTPLLQSPLELGADCVVYSATKHIDGQGRCLGGVILGSREVHHRPHPHAASARPARRCRRSTPGCCSRAWRRSRCACARQTDTAAKVAVALAEHPEGRRG